MPALRKQMPALWKQMPSLMDLVTNYHKHNIMEKYEQEYGQRELQKQKCRRLSLCNLCEKQDFPFRAVSLPYRFKLYKKFTL